MKVKRISIPLKIYDNMNNKVKFNFIVYFNKGSDNSEDKK